MTNYYSTVSHFCVGDTIVRKKDHMSDGVWPNYMSRNEQVSLHVIEKINGQLIKLKGHQYEGWIDEYFTLVHSNYKPLEEGEYL